MNARKLFLVAVLAAGPAVAQGPGGQGPPALVEVAPVVEEQVVTTRAFVGDVQADRRSTVGAERAGLVTEFLVGEGDVVEADQPLARLRTETLEIELEAARATLALRRSELEELENGARTEELAEARAQVSAAQAALDLRTWRRESAERLFERGTIPEDEVKEARFAERSAEEVLAERKAAAALVEAGPRAERIAQARARVAVAESEVHRLENDLARHTIRAPFAGSVLAERTEVGQWLAVGSPVVELAALEEVEVAVPVPEDDIAGVTVGMEVDVRVPAAGPDRFAGTVARIVPVADARARTFPVKVRVANRMENGTFVLKAGMFGRVEFAIGERVTALLVPKDALVLGGPRPVVYALDPETMTVRPVSVETGVASGERIQVSGPLQPGTQVVTKGNERLRPGQAVRLGASEG